MTQEHGGIGATSPRSRPRLIDVAERSGVTKSVVSRIMNADPTLRTRPETRERVLEIARELGYRPHAGARALSVARTGTLAFLIPDLTNTVYSTILRGAIRRASELSYVVLIAEDAAESPAGANEYADLVSTGRVDGLLVGSARPDSPLLASLAGDSRSIAHVFVNREVPGSGRNVGLDIAGAAALVVDYLHAQGHTEIGLVSGPLELQPARSRIAGFQARMEALGLDGSRVRTGPFNETGGHGAATELLGAHPELTAVFGSTFGQSLGCLKAVTRLGLSVPGDVSVIGYDDLPAADFLIPSLTTVAMPLDQLGVAAVDALVAQIEGADPADVTVTGGSHVVERNSVGPARARA
ncbi:LacI family DNA-binding transcriptional regulator [Serinibacter salmoneus]|uniref:LacI family transcriptional regulator n=1 Tax=Serinibacter salmoneus TaxID=556530 RepID=A0A2A9D2P9_9MICO|nr:LacI family DNA-binding transcriptional regulator [Serinibacter salmoneus]PFG20977.1 LacI family transcriptional regulator [Serinibacter salmoneus]